MLQLAFVACDRLTQTERLPPVACLASQTRSAAFTTATVRAHCSRVTGVGTPDVFRCVLVFLPCTGESGRRVSIPTRTPENCCGCSVNSRGLTPTDAARRTRHGVLAAALRVAHDALRLLRHAQVNSRDDWPIPRSVLRQQRRTVDDQCLLGFSRTSVPSHAKVVAPVTALRWPVPVPVPVAFSNRPVPRVIW